MPRRRFDPLIVFGMPLTGGGLVVPALGEVLYVNTSHDGQFGNGRAQDKPFQTISAAIAAVTAGRPTTIFIGPGSYDETVTIARAKNKLVLWGVGGRGAAFIDPSTEDAAGMLVHADDVTLVNLGVAAEDETSAVALTVTGSRFRAHNCKIEGGAKQVVVGPGTVAQEAAGTHGRGGDSLFDDCEICWGTNGIVLKSSDFGACTQARIRLCLFHNLTGDELDEDDAGAIGAFRDLWAHDNIFAVQEDGTAPTKFCDLDSVGSTGLLARNVFETTVLASALIGIAAGVLFLGNQAQAEGAATGGGTSGRPD